MSVLHPKSEECLRSELELFQPPRFQGQLSHWHYVDYYPLTSLDKGGPIEFLINGNTDTYIDLNESFLYLKFKILKGDGSSITEVSHSGTNYNSTLVAPINAFHSSHFRSVETYLNSTLISQTDNLYGYKAYIQKLLTYGPDAKTTFLECGQFYEDYGILEEFAATEGVMDTRNVHGF